ncbi:MAG TPA: TIGR00730 family Rossman fold protein [Patescibacteria group bacterium]|jgi:hypothetical protein|nr:TIGR00730 family Rossman fold protein [Patescibacteria group bacterium]
MPSKLKQQSKIPKNKHNPKDQHMHRVCAVLPANVNEEDVAWTNGQLEELLSIKRGGFSSRRLVKIMNEFVTGYKFIRHFKKAVTIFGSARNTLDKHAYKEARKLGYKLAEANFAVITGGGPGIMQAANEGALEFGGESVGLNIQLPSEQRINPFVNESSSFHYFFTRKVMLASVSQVYVFFPGGFGTMDELFEMLTLIQTKKVAPIKVILVNKRFWTPLVKWINVTIYGHNKAISRGDLALFNIVDNADQAMDLIHKMVRQQKIGHISREADSLGYNKREGVVMPKSTIRKISAKSAKPIVKDPKKRVRKMSIE